MNEKNTKDKTKTTINLSLSYKKNTIVNISQTVENRVSTTDKIQLKLNSDIKIQSFMEVDYYDVDEQKFFLLSEDNEPIEADDFGYDLTISSELNSFVSSMQENSWDVSLISSSIYPLLVKKEKANIRSSLIQQFFTMLKFNVFIAFIYSVYIYADKLLEHNSVPNLIDIIYQVPTEMLEFIVVSAIILTLINVIRYMYKVSEGVIPPKNL